jgi:hypothetical protein
MASRLDGDSSEALGRLSSAGERLALDDDDYLEEDNEGFSRPDSVWARPTSFANAPSTGRSSIQALRGRSVVNNRKKTLEAGLFSSIEQDSDNKACAQFQVDLTATSFGICKCGFPKVDHVAKAPVVKVVKAEAKPWATSDSTSPNELEGILQKLSSKRVWNKRFFKLNLSVSSPSLMYYPQVRNAWNMAKRGKPVLDQCSLAKVEMKSLEIHLTADNGSVAALKAKSTADATRWYEGLQRLVEIQQQRP